MPSYKAEDCHQNARNIMKRATDKLVALQFLAVVLPIAVVLLVQLAADARRAASLDHSRPLRILADEARTNYKTFMNGAADAVDTNSLGPQSVQALRTAAAAAACALLLLRSEPAPPP